MKKNLSIIFVSLSAILILDTMNAGHALAMFLLAGIIPGTDIEIDAGRMFEFIVLLTGFTLSRITTNLVRAYGARQQGEGHPSKGTMLSAHS